MTISRRDVIKLAALGGALGAVYPAWHLGSQTFAKLARAPEKPTREIIFSGFRIGEAFKAKTAGLHIGGTDIDQRVQLANEIHSIIFSRKMNMKVFIPKLELVAYLQVGNGEYRSFQAAPGNYFYGHGVIDEKRGVLYTTQAKITADRLEMARRNEQGFIYVHSLPDLKELGRFDSHGFDPHDLLMNGDQLVVCNGGSGSNIAFIDLSNRQLIKTHALNVTSHLSLRHIDHVEGDRYVVASLSLNENLPAPLFDLDLSTGLRRYISPPMVDVTLCRAQILSIKHHDGYLYGTCPLTDSLIVWKHGGSFVGGVSIPSAANISYSKALGGMIIGSGIIKEPARLVKMIDGKIQFSMLPWAKNISGSHSVIVDT